MKIPLRRGGEEPAKVTLPLSDCSSEQAEKVFPCNLTGQ